MKPAVEVIAFDHLVLVTRDVERLLGWYRDVLGLEPVRFEEWRAGDAPFPSVRIDSGTIIDFVEGEPTGVNVAHICLAVAATDLGALAGTGLEVTDGPGPRFGARGVGESVYVLDPDGNTVELRHYGRQT